MEHITRSTTALKQLFIHYLYLSIKLDSLEQSRNGHNNVGKYWGGKSISSKNLIMCSRNKRLRRLTKAKILPLTSKSHPWHLTVYQRIFDVISNHWKTFLLPGPVSTWLSCVTRMWYAYWYFFLKKECSQHLLKHHWTLFCNFTRAISESFPLHSPDKVSRKGFSLFTHLVSQVSSLGKSLSKNSTTEREHPFLDSFHQKTPSKAHDSAHHNYIYTSGHLFFNSF